MVVRPHLQRLVERVRIRQSPLPAAIVYPCDSDSLQFALSGAFAGYIAPELVGPEARIRDVANHAGFDISRLPIVDTPDNPRAAGTRAAERARDGLVQALIKGSLGDEDLLAPVAAPESGLRGDRRLSHAFFLDLPGRSQGLLVADALLNVTPNLAAKKDIVANTIDLAYALGVTTPAVALLAAIEAVTPAFPSTAEAMALKSMSMQGAFRDARVDGPLTPDTALSRDAARANNSKSEIAGNADVLIAPGMESASMLVRTLIAMTGGLAAGLVIGAKVPVVAPARSESMETRMASCVLASLAVHAARDAATSAGGVAADARITEGSRVAA
jgi:phosphate acetyltransferase